MTLELDQLVALKRNPQYLTEKQTEALKTSIQRDGFLAPIVVRKRGKKYEILSGNHRTMAMRELDQTKIDCVEILNCSDEQAARIAVNMNTVHGEPTPELIAPFLADLDEDTLASVHLEPELLRGLLAFDEALAERLKSLQAPRSIDRDSPRGTIPNCVCKCGHRHIALAKANSKSSRRKAQNTRG